MHVELQNQGNYSQTIDKYAQSSQSSRPDLVVFPEYVVQRIADSDTVIPIGACLEASGFDTSTFQPSTLTAYSTGGVQWGMPFSVSNPVLYYNKNVFEDAGLDPDDPPRSLEEVRQYSQQIVDSGAASYGIAVDSGTDSGGGWFLEQWFANAGELYADNGNGRLAPATQVLYDGAARRRVADVRAAVDQRRPRLQRRRQRRRHRHVLQARRRVGAGGDDDRDVGRARHGDRGARAAG